MNGFVIDNTNIENKNMTGIEVISGYDCFRQEVKFGIWSRHDRRACPNTF